MRLWDLGMARRHSALKTDVKLWESKGKLASRTTTLKNTQTLLLELMEMMHSMAKTLLMHLRVLMLREEITLHYLSGLNLVTQFLKANQKDSESEKDLTYHCWRGHTDSTNRNNAGSLQQR
jgi:hypothetical protein